MEREEQIPSSGASKTPVVSFRPAGRRRAASDGDAAATETEREVMRPAQHNGP